MNEAIADFITYLTQTKHYSAHTVVGYETDIRGFIRFFENISEADCKIWRRPIRFAFARIWPTANETD